MAMISSEELRHGAVETEGLSLSHPGGRYPDSVCTDLLESEFPSDLGYDPREEGKTIGDSDPCAFLEGKFHDFAVSCHSDYEHDMLNAPPLTGGPIDLGSEYSDDYSDYEYDMLTAPPPPEGPIDLVDIDSEYSDDYLEDDEHDEFADQPTNCPGRIRNIPKRNATKISLAGLRTLVQRNRQYLDLRDEILSRDDDADLPPVPLDVLAEATGVCVLRGYCHHIEYRTHDTSTTESTLGYDEPELMLQIFSLRLSNFSISFPISVYGVFAVRDVLEPLRNHAFNRCRDDAVTVDQDPLTLPLCSPCRGMYLPYDRALLEVDLWVKKDGDGSADQQLLSAYVELDVRTEVNKLLEGCIPGDTCSLEIDYLYLTESVEAVIEVSAEVAHPHHVRFAAFSSGYEHEIVLFDDKFSGKKDFKHVVAVKAEGELNVRLELKKSLFQWTFRDGNVGALSSPDDSILNYGRFHVKVYFAQRN